MISINTYYSDYHSLEKLVSEHRNLFESAQKRSVLVQIFSGICDKTWLESLRCEIRTLLPDATIIGTTTMGEIMNGEVSSLKTAISITLFDATDLIPLRETRGSASCFELGRAIAEKSKRANSKVLILFSTLLEHDASEMLNGIAATDKALIVAGGCAGSNMEKKNGFVVSDDDVSDQSVVAVALAGDRLDAKQFWHLCWTPVGKWMTITGAENTRVYTIDNQPAFQVYRKYLGLPDRDSSVLSQIFPVLLKRHGVDVVQAPVTVNSDDSINFRGELHEGEKIRFSYGHVGMMLDSVDSLIENIKSAPVDSIFVYSCGWRRAFLQDSTEIETKPLQNLAPTAGFFTNGEFFHAGNANQLLTGTMTTLALSESGEDATNQPRPKEDAADAIADSGTVDNLSLKGSDIIKTLTSLVESTTLELNEKISELEAINDKVRFDSIHDVLSGLYNRNFYEEEFARIDRCIGSAGIIIGDLDGLKLTNDTIGHTAGDEIIRTASEILSRFQAKNRLFFRVGGDEFVMIETEGTQESIDSLVAEIEKHIFRYSESSNSVPLSISLGSAYESSACGKMQDLFAEADRRMYENKLRRSKDTKENLAVKLLARWKKNTFRSERERNETKKTAASFARYLGLDASMTDSIGKLAEYHDIGEIGVQSAIYEKKDPLSAKEKTAIERHAEIGFRVAQASNDLISVADLVLKHHEWWNGQGYPVGLREDHIPIECRMMGVVIAYMAMTNDRPHRKARNRAEALEELRKKAGSEFDPEMVDSFIRMLAET